MYESPTTHLYNVYIRVSYDKYIHESRTMYENSYDIYTCISTYIQGVEERGFREE